MDRRLIYDACMERFARGLSQKQIAAELKISRSTVQRKIWISKMGAEVQAAYFDGRLREDYIPKLHKGDLAFDDIDLQEPREQHEPMRLEYEIHRALERATNKTVIATLQWVLKRKDSLIHDHRRSVD